MEIRTSIHEIIARRICTVVLCVAVSYVSYHFGRYMMKKEMKMKEKYGSKKES